MNRGIAGARRIALVAAALWLLWVEWRPPGRPWPKDIARPEAAGALHALAAGRDFLISGRVQPLPGESVRDWQGRFVFRHRQRQDQSSSSGKAVRVVTVAEHRPALRWVGPAGSWTVPADSYGLEHAPRIEPRFWPRKWLGTTRVDDWDKSSTGFRAGEATLALGHIDPDGRPVIRELWPGSIKEAVAQWQAVERPRAWLILAVKLTLSLVALLWCFGRRRFPRLQPDRTRARAPVDPLA